MEFLTFQEIAERAGVGIDTVRRAVRKYDDLTVHKQKTPTSRGAVVSCLNKDDANWLVSQLDRTGEVTDDASASLERFGYFYILQLIPEALPNRVKIGFTDNLDTRLREHQTAAQTAVYVGHWPCKRSWDHAAMDSITREGCNLVMNEVYEGDRQGFLDRAQAFFALMPKPSDRLPLSEHSPLNRTDDDE